MPIWRVVEPLWLLSFRRGLPACLSGGRIVIGSTAEDSLPIPEVGISRTGVSHLWFFAAWLPPQTLPFLFVALQRCA